MTAVLEPGLPAAPRPGLRLDPELRRVGAVALAVLAVAVAAIVVTATLGGRTATYAPGTPEAAFQGYLERVAAGDLESAYACFSAGVRGRMPFDEFAMQTDGNRGAASRVQIDRAVVDGGSARLDLTIDHWWAGGLQSSRYREQRTLRLVREAGGWKIDQALVGIDQAW